MHYTNIIIGSMITLLKRLLGIVEQYRTTIIITLSRAVFIALFAYSATDKLADFDVYSIKMHRQPFPEYISAFLVIAVPMAELCASVLTAIQKTYRYGLYSSFSLMASFTTYALFAYREFWGYVPCACGALFSSMGWRIHAAFNLELSLIAFAGILSMQGNRNSGKMPMVCMRPEHTEARSHGPELKPEVQP